MMTEFLTELRRVLRRRNAIGVERISVEFSRRKRNPQDFWLSANCREVGIWPRRRGIRVALNASPHRIESGSCVAHGTRDNEVGCEPVGTFGQIGREADASPRWFQSHQS